MGKNTKKRFGTFACCAMAMILSLAACGGRTDLLGEPGQAVPLTYLERAHKGEDYAHLLSAANGFAASFAPAAAEGSAGNVALAPVSVYMALALSAECASGETREELLSVLGVPYETLRNEFSDFYRGLTAEYKEGKKIAMQVTLGNSVWIADGTPTNQSCIDALASRYHCYSYAADFLHDNPGANRAVRKFVKEETHGLIDRDFELSEYTLFALLNTLYLKDIWREAGAELPLTDEMAFAQTDGTEKELPFLQGTYAAGRAYEGANFRTFFARTDHGYRLRFLVPEEGVPLSEVFTEETLLAVGELDDNAFDEATKTRYFTRCLFPAFEAAFDGSVKSVLEDMGISRLFRDPGVHIGDGCEFETLTEEGVYCSDVRHVTELKVDRRGIEGAAVTVVGMDAATAEPPEWEEVYEDFVVDRAFGFVLTDPYGTTLFSGAVKEV